MKKGFTIVEISIVMAIMVMVGTLSYGTYRIWHRRVVLVNNTSELRSNLVKVQQLALAAAQNTDWGIHLEQNSYIIFSGSFYNQDDPSNQVKQIIGSSIINPAGTFTDSAGGFTSNVVFTKFTGLTYNTGTIALTDEVGMGGTKYITVEAGGKIE